MSPYAMCRKPARDVALGQPFFALALKLGERAAVETGFGHQANTFPHAPRFLMLAVPRSVEKHREAPLRSGGFDRSPEGHSKVGALCR